MPCHGYCRQKCNRVSVVVTASTAYPKEPEVQVFITTNNSNLRELCGITLGSDLFGNAENASRGPSDALRETPQGLARARQALREECLARTRQAPGEEKPGDEENLREGNIKGADPWRETLQQSHNSIVELKELPAHLTTTKTPRRDIQ